MNNCNTEQIYSKHGINLLKGTCRNGNEVYYVTGCCQTKTFEDYDDALCYYNFQWLRIEDSMKS